jgi:CRISPR-associated endonuclease Cas2
MKRPPAISRGEQIARLRRSGLAGSDWLQPEAEAPAGQASPFTTLAERLALLRRLRPQRITHMMCFIAYDIESNKVRTRVAKYLIAQGCHRIQKSVYFAQLSRHQYRDIVEALRVINDLYENQDSIFFLPVGEDNMSKFEVVGRDLYLEVAREQHHTVVL